MTQTAGKGALALALAFVACQKREHEPPPLVEQPAAIAPATKQRLHPPLPEDPKLAAKSSAQWAEHLHEEEEHRQLCYDRDRLVQHRAMMTELASLRQRVDRARSEADVAKARADGQRLAPDLQKRLDAIDPWKNSSMVLPDQQAMLKLLVESYPDTRRESLRGNAQNGANVAAELDRRAESIQKLLARAERCKDE